MTSGTAQTWNDDPFAIRESRQSWKFPTPGTVHEGTVVAITPGVQSRDPKTGELQVWPKGGPKLNVVIDLDTAEGPQSFWVPSYSKNSKNEAIRAAQQELGRPIQVGDTLKVAFTGVDPETATDPLPRKLYRAKIEPGALGGAGDPFAAPKGPAAAHPAAQDDEPPF